ncbi:hypothetical protein C5167_032381 [Papaver somniferum]|uniref:Uncharacterized protein n=1 Tax=Papaver somniferum TaxID=3469 RepID=A0A4Y7K7F9_PAPSO|nr:hypothetical protein C5167_032381 [Papaver somniferum]
MELFTAAEDLKFFNPNQIIKEAVKIPAKSSPVKFFFITLTLILPLSLMHHEIDHSSPSYKQFIRSYSIHEFFYILSLFLFSILSTSVIVFTVASLYASKSVSFIPTLFAIPRIFKHLMITFFYVLLLMIVNYSAYYIPLYVLASMNSNGALFWGVSIIFAVIYDLVHIYVTAQWHLASVISVLEANGYGLAAMKKSTQLLRGRTSIFRTSKFILAGYMDD